MKHVHRRSLKHGRDRYCSTAHVKGGVVPAGEEIQFHAYRVPGKGLPERIVDGAREWMNELSRIVKTRSLSRPTIVLEDTAERTAGT